LATASDFVARLCLPWNQFGRKNVGHLYAILHGATTVWDFDDDNELLVPAGDLLAGCASQTILRESDTNAAPSPTPGPQAHPPALCLFCDPKS